MNVWTISGYLGKDARTRTVTARGEEKFVVNFNVGVNDGKKGGEKQTLWVSVVGWGDFYEGVSKFLKKGTYVNVTGRAALEPARDDYEARLQLVASSIELGPNSTGRQNDSDDEPEPEQEETPEEEASF